MRLRAGVGAAVATAGLVVACGGKVIFDTSATGTGGAAGSTSPSTSLSVENSSSTGFTCLTTSSVGGPMGPGTVHTTKCVMLGAKQCPPVSGAASYLQADSCYVIQSVDDACGSPIAQCCYDVTEQLNCKG